MRGCPPYTIAQEVMEACRSIGRAFQLIASCLKMLLVWGHWAARRHTRTNAARESAL